MDLTENPTFANQRSSSDIVGKPMVRIDGRAKVMGAATYSAEYNQLPGLVHAVFKTSDVAKGRITGFDDSEAKRLPGVLGILTHLNMPPLSQTPATPEGKKKIALAMQMSFTPMLSDQIFYAGQPVAIVIADTLEHAQHAAALLKVSIVAEQLVASYRDTRAELFAPKEGPAAQVPAKRGDAQSAFAKAPVQLTLTCQHVTNHHNPMEPGATIAHWEAADRVTVYDTTQAIASTHKALYVMLGLPPDNVRVVNKYLGGGFGCKLTMWPHTVLTVQAAKFVGRPVKLVLTRPQMFTSMGHREDQEQTLRVGATKEGKLLALLHEKTSTTSPWDNYAEMNSKIVDMLYACPTFEASVKLARANVMTSTYMRGPGEAPGSFAMECAMDDLAYQVGLDPIAIRLLNHADKDPGTGKPWSSKSLKQCYERGAELFGWSKRNPKNGATRQGNSLVGWGMASGSYPVHDAQGNARVRLFADGHALVQAGATDLGTGTYTIITQVAADSLGIPPEKVHFELGDSALPTTAMSGGSRAAGTVSSSVFLAAQDVWQKLIKVAVTDQHSPVYKAKPADVEAVKGRLQLKTDATKGEAFTTLMQRISLDDVEGVATGHYGSSYESPEATLNTPEAKKDDAGGHSMHSFSAHFCEVQVDTDLGTVHVTRWVSVVAAGRILNTRTARSQVMGGSIFGIGAALMEGTVCDPHLARYTNASLADYHVCVNADIPEMTVAFIDEEDRYVNAMGVKGLGEVSIVGTSAAVSNAIFHAIGHRLTSLPITPDKVLKALGKTK
ncbi:xanthine dehydrogenase family protein molybdopterin-binding subunit [Spirosoma jeollabukense]